MAVPVAAASILHSGNCGAQGDNVQWAQYDDGTLVISGSGAMEDYEGISGVPWYNYRNGLNKLVLSEGITNIGDYAFRTYFYPGYTGTLTIPSTVTRIGKEAFYACDFTGTLTIPSSVKVIEDSAFAYCSGFTGTLNIPKSITNINWGAFQGCSGFTGTLVIPNSITSIGEYAFNECTGFTGTLYIPSSVTSIGKWAFNGCSGITSVVIPSSVTEMGNKNFYYLPKNSVIYYSCDSKLIYSLQYFVDKTACAKDNGDGSFTFDSEIESLPLSSENAPQKLGYTFDGWYSDSSFLTPVSSIPAKTNPTLWAKWVSLAPQEYSITVSSTSGGSVSVSSKKAVPGSTVSLTPTADSGYIFKNWQVLSGGVTVVNNKFTMPANNVVVKAVFEAVESSPEITASGKTGDLTWVLYDDGKLVISGEGAMPNYPSSSSVPWSLYRNLITSVVIEAGVTSIGEFAFYYCRDLTSVIISSSVTSIGGEVFDDCKSLLSIHLPSSVTSVSTAAFLNCRNLTSITVDDGNMMYKDINGVLFSKDGTFLHTYPAGKSAVSYDIPSGVKSIGERAFYYCSRLTSITIPSSVTNIGSSVFHACSCLTSISVEMGNTKYKDIDGVLFSKDGTLLHTYPAGKSVTSYKIPSGVTNIGNEAFYGCSNLTSITIPSGVASIGASTFWCCNSLTSITISSDVISIGSYAFYACNSLTSITISSGVTRIGSSAFKDCRGLTSITFSSGVTSIGDEAFEYCSSLMSIVLPSSVTSIDRDAFRYLATNSIIYCADTGLLSGKYSSDRTALAVKNTDGSYKFTSAVTNLALSEANAPFGATYGGWFKESSFTTQVTSIAADTNPTLWLKTDGEVPDDAVIVPSDGKIDGYIFSIEPVSDDFETCPCTVVFQIICTEGFSSFKFDFGDGSDSVTSYSSQLQHTYVNGGTYHVSLTAVYDGVTYVYQKKIVINSFKKNGEITILSTPVDQQYIGDNIIFTGKNTYSDYVILYIKDLNAGFTQITTPILVKEDGSWEYIFDTSKKYTFGDRQIHLDAGLLVFYVDAVLSPDAEPAESQGDLIHYAEASVVLKQPFITLNKCPTSVMTGESIHVEGDVPGADTLCYYLIGRDTFKSGFIDVKEDNLYSADIPTEGLTGSQYLIIQHPMYDKIHNIYLDSDGCVYMIRDADDTPRVLFDTAKITGLKAANALCDNLDSQNIDDMYAKALVEIYPESGIIISNCLDISSIVDDPYEFAGYSSEGNVDLYLKFPDNSLVRLTEKSAVPVNKIWHTSVSIPCFDTVGTYALYAAAGYAANTPVESELLTHPHDVLSATVDLIFDDNSPRWGMVRGEPFEVSGYADDTLLVQYYLFGTNWFKSGKIAVLDDKYSLSTMLYSIEDEHDKYVMTGQYFLVLQHPGKDKVFNIAPISAEEMPESWRKHGYNIVLNKAGSATAADTIIFNTEDRQSANAAQALCDALSSEDIDDTYIKASFIVGEQASFINEIPPQISKGQILTVSGYTLGHIGDVVSVELLSTEFAAVPKETVDSASFVAKTTKVSDDGRWKISFDTSCIKADEYICSVVVGQLDAKVSKVMIVGGSNPPQPNPQPPTEPIVGGDSGTIHIHTNVPGAKVSFYVIDIAASGQPADVQYADANGDAFIKVYTTATPPKYVLVTAPGYIQDTSSQATLAVPAPGEMLRYDILLTPISQTPYISGLLPLPAQPVRGDA